MTISWPPDVSALDVSAWFYVAEKKNRRFKCIVYKANRKYDEISCVEKNR